MHTSRRARFMEMKQPRDEYLDLYTAAQRLGFARATLNVFVLQGRLPAERWGRQWFVRRDDLEAFADVYYPSGAARELGSAYVAFVGVAERPGITVEELATLLGRPKRTVLGWLQDLDRRGLVERRRRNQSRDPARCFLTEAGSELYGEERAVATDRVKA
jgi:excisionase family DNA binding protein